MHSSKSSVIFITQPWLYRFSRASLLTLWTSHWPYKQVTDLINKSTTLEIDLLFDTYRQWNQVRGDPGTNPFINIRHFIYLYRFHLPRKQFWYTLSDNCLWFTKKKSFIKKKMKRSINRYEKRRLPTKKKKKNARAVCVCVCVCAWFSLYHPILDSLTLSKKERVLFMWLHFISDFIILQSDNVSMMEL
jgi:hypothetical protein